MSCGWLFIRRLGRVGDDFSGSVIDSVQLGDVSHRSVAGFQ